MARIKKLAAMCTAAALAGSLLTGCADTGYCMSYGEEKVNAGVYLYNMLSEMSYQTTMMYYQNGVTDDFMSQKIDGKDFAEYIEDTALAQTKEYCAVVAKFNELGLELSDEDLKSVSDSVNDTWQSQQDFYEEMGISKESIKLVQKEAKMKDYIFEHYYGVGGEKEVTDEALTTYINESYVRYKSVAIPKSTESDETAKAAADKESQALRDKYLEEAGKLTFADFDTVIDEYNDYVAAQSKTDSSSEAVSDASDSTADSSSAASDDSDAAVDSSVVSDDTSSVADTSSSSDSSSAVEEIGSESDSTSSEDPYVNEKMSNFAVLDEDALDSVNGKLLTEVNGLTVNVASSYDNDSYFYVLMKGDVSERSAEYASENHDTVLQEMKGDEFDEMIKTWIEDLKISENGDAMKRYTCQKVYDKQTKYSEEHGNS